MVPTVITPYSTVEITVGQNHGVRPYKDGATVQYDFYRNLAVWLQFRPKIIFFFLQQVSMNKTQITNQESSTASDFEFPCNPLLGPSPELMQTQPSLWVVQGSIVWLRHIRGAHRGAKMGDLGVERGLSEAIFAPAVLAWHRTKHRTVNCRNYGNLRSSKIVITP